jgi:hypothetical protein
MAVPVAIIRRQRRIAGQTRLAEVIPPITLRLALNLKECLPRRVVTVSLLLQELFALTAPMAGSDLASLKGKPRAA